MIKSTDGFSIGNVFLDFLGGMANYAQMVTQSIDQSIYLSFLNSHYTIPNDLMHALIHIMTFLNFFYFIL
jgi:cystinosin